MKPAYSRSSELLHRQTSRVLIVDVQEKLIAAMRNPERLIANCRMLAEGASLFDIPITITEQYPQGLGKTVSALQEFDSNPAEKKRFSSAEVIDWKQASEQNTTEQDTARTDVVIAGIEAHVCILQTTLDFIAQGYRTFLAVDAISSRFSEDFDWALERLALAGAVLTTTESILFEWCETAEAKEFKAISQLVRSREGL